MFLLSDPRRRGVSPESLQTVVSALAEVDAEGQPEASPTAAAAPGIDPVSTEAAGRQRVAPDLRRVRGIVVIGARLPGSPPPHLPSA